MKLQNPPFIIPSPQCRQTSARGISPSFKGEEPKPRATIEVLAKTAANWWAQQLKKPTQNNGDPMFSLMASFAGLDKPESDEAIQKFQVALEKFIEGREKDYQITESGKLFLSFHVDYHPEYELWDIAKVAGMDPGSVSFPVKTSMWIKPEGIRVSKGYGMKAEDVPLLEG